MERITPDQYINLWVHMYDLNTLFGHGFRDDIAYSPTFEQWENRKRNWKELDPTYSPPG